jgi:hypothetical protein
MRRLGRCLGRCLGVAGVVAIVLAAAVLVQGSETSGARAAHQHRQGPVEVVVGAAPSGGLSLVTRARSSGDGDAWSVNRFSTSEVVGAALGLAVSSLLSGWFLVRPERRCASPSRRASRAAPRAPPRLLAI